MLALPYRLLGCYAQARGGPVVPHTNVNVSGNGPEAMGTLTQAQAYSQSLRIGPLWPNRAAWRWVLLRKLRGVEKEEGRHSTAHCPERTDTGPESQPRRGLLHDSENQPQEESCWVKCWPDMAVELWAKPLTPAV